MPYLNLDLNYYNHRKTLRLQKLLGKGAAELPIRLWVHAAQFHPENGYLLGYSDSEIEEIAEWSGEPGKMIEVMTKPEIMLLEKVDSGYAIHDWLDHAGHIAAFKRRAKTAAKKRWKRYATSIRQASSMDATTGKVRKGKVGKVEGESQRGEEEKIYTPVAAVKLFQIQKACLNQESVDHQQKPKTLLRQFTDYFCQSFEYHFQQKYQFQKAKDMESTKRIMASRTMEEVKTLVDRFFVSTDPFIKQSGYTIGVFESQINKLIAGGSNNNGDRGSSAEPRGAAGIREFLAARQNKP